MDSSPVCVEYMEKFNTRIKRIELLIIISCIKLHSCTYYTAQNLYITFFKPKNICTYVLTYVGSVKYLYKLHHPYLCSFKFW